jgi:hypothetical protein
MGDIMLDNSRIRSTKQDQHHRLSLRMVDIQSQRRPSIIKDRMLGDKLFAQKSKFSFRTEWDIWA